MKNNAAHKKSLDYNYITDGIYIGNNQCCQIHFDEKLKTKGITADISLEENRLDAPFGVDFYLWLPVKDHTPPSFDQLTLSVSVIERLVSLKKKVYIHCRNGHGRAPTLVAAYLVKKGQSPLAAEQFIKSKRPAVHLQAAQRQALKLFVK